MKVLRAWLAMAELLLVMVYKHSLVMLRYPLHVVSSFIVIVAMMMVNLLGVLSFTEGGLVSGLRQAGESPLAGVALYGFVLYIFASDALWLVAVHVRKEQVEGTLESLYLTSASRVLYQVSRVVFSFGWSGVRAVFCLGVVWMVVGALPVAHVVLAVYTLVCTLAGIAGFNLCFAALTLYIKQAAQSAAVLLQFVMLTLCAMVFPFRALPGVVQFVARVVPFSYHVDLFRSALIGFPVGFPELGPVVFEVGVVTLSGILMPMVGFFFYHWLERRIRQVGNLAEF